MTVGGLRVSPSRRRAEAPNSVLPPGDAARLATKVKADEEGRVVEVDLNNCRDMKELPASVGKLQALTKLLLTNCEGLTALPA